MWPKKPTSPVRQMCNENNCQSAKQLLVPDYRRKCNLSIGGQWKTESQKSQVHTMFQVQNKQIRDIKT